MSELDFPGDQLEPPMVIKTKNTHFYINDEGEVHEYQLGPRSDDTHEQYQNVTKALRDDQFRRCLRDAEKLHEDNDIPDLEESNKQFLDDVVMGIHDNGRGIAGICCVQLFIKSVEPRLSTRLHKGNRKSSNFSWVDGWSVRTLDNELDGKGIGVELNNRGLLLGNTRGGSAMTRGLAESEPYTPIFNPALEGPRESWLEVVERLESNDIDPESGLMYFLKRLFDEREVIVDGVSKALTAVKQFNESDPSIEDVENLLVQHMEQADQQAKLLEVAAHSILQAVEDVDGLPGDLKRLEELTAANRRSGTSTREADDVGDVEISRENKEGSLLHAWDMKYVDIDSSELSSLKEKLKGNAGVERAGFVSIEAPGVDENMSDLETEIKNTNGVDVEYMSLTEFRETYIDDASVSLDSVSWLEAFVETLGRRRMDRALVRQSPVTWLEDLVKLIEKETGKEINEDTEDYVASSGETSPDYLQSGITDFS